MSMRHAEETFPDAKRTLAFKKADNVERVGLVNMVDRVQMG